MKKIALLGSTGSIGRSALRVVDSLGSEYKIVGLACRRNIGILEKQIKKFHPRVVAVMDEQKARELRSSVIGSLGDEEEPVYSDGRSPGHRSSVYAGLPGLVKVATYPGVNFVIFAITGAVCLKPILAALKSKKQIALANKEALVMAGKIISAVAKRQGIKILPIDSEHSAIFQCLESRKLSSVKNIILTASGGPFYSYPPRALTNVSVKDTLAHPTWKMGRKITVDSATLMNKGLEIIEAHWLFGIDVSRIKVIIHPQSIIHSMVEFVDGTIIAQLGITDMRLPIQYSLTYPERAKGLPGLELAKLPPLTFEKLNLKRFPCLALAWRTARRGGTMPAVLNAADEMAVKAFLNHKIKFLEIPELIKKVLAKHKVIKNPTLKDILNADAWARKEAVETYERKS